MQASTNASTARGALELAAPINRWDEAVPLGNGLMGGLLWGSGNTIKLSLDRGDLWDLRTPETLLRKDWTWATIQSLVAAKDQAKIVELFDDPYGKVPYATKIPAGRLEFTFGPDQSVESFALDFERAVGRARIGGAQLEVFFSAAENVALIGITGPQPQWRIVPPDSLKQLGYAAPQTGRDGDVAWSLQEAALGLKYAVVVDEKRVGDATQLAVAIASTRDGADPLAEGRKRVAAALAMGYNAMLTRHVEWWKGFWSQSSVSIPDEGIQRHYDLVQYFYGAASRRGAPPIPLQGVWTADEGALPPWHGDYHHDLNTQLTYWAYLTAGHFDEGACFLDFMWDLLPACRTFAQQFFNAPGAAVPGVMTLDGKPMGGWGQYSLSPVQGAWIAQAFYLHWRYTMDERFLKERAYPYGAEIAECLFGLMKPDARGKLKLPLSSSPEIHDNSLRAWLTPNSNYDLSLMRWLFAALQDMARTLGDDAAAARWQQTLGQLDDLAVEGDNGALRLSLDESFAESHRHFSHLMAIYPLGTLHIEGSDRDRKIVAASLKQLDQFGTGAWCGYSLTWRACLAARTGDAEAALANLTTFVEKYISRNGFHLNWDYRKTGSRPFTLEGNFAAAQAVNEMLLQSWGGVIRVFPAVPQAWQDVSFEDLRAEGAFKVTAQRKQGRTTLVRVTAEKGGNVRLRDPFAGQDVAWNRQDIKKAGSDLECTLEPGAILEGRVCRERWTPEHARAWYKQQPWLCGFNFVPSTAGNTTELWQAETFDPETIARELGWARDTGFNTCRVFLQYLVWKHDPEGLKARMDRFLTLAHERGISVVFVFFDDCTFGDPPQTEPVLGKQREPEPGLVMPGWTPSPGLKAVTDKTVWPDLERYVKDIVGRFADDPRVVFWDLYNEPGNSRMNNQSLPLVEAVFGWARQARPSQPLTIGIWIPGMKDLNAKQIELSDIITYHAYTNLEGMRAAIAEHKRHGRPVICTEWMARILGGCWKTDLPLFRQEDVGCYNWGLVNGRTQTQFPWNSPKGSPEPKVWFHDLFHKDGTPYDPEEIAVIRAETRAAAESDARRRITP